MSDLQQAIANAGLGQHHIIHDGKIHRIAGDDDKPGTKNCWYISFVTAGAFGSWKLGFTKTWHDKIDRSKNDDAALAKQIKAAQKQRQAEIARSQKKAQETARYLWASGAESIIHDYLVKKEIIPYRVRQVNDRILVPMFFDGQLVNIQQIDRQGTKRFLKGGRVKGAYCNIGKIKDSVLIAEGWATACTLHEFMRQPVIIAFNANNLLPAVKAILEKYPDIQITVACDNDRQTKGNPGLTKGRQAAAAVGGDVIWPVFDEGQEGTDFNDYVLAGGIL